MTNIVKAEFVVAGSDQHVYIATPAHTIYPNFHISVLRSIPRLIQSRVSVTYAHLAGYPHVDDARNLLAHDFLETKATDILMWDADVGAQSDAVQRILKHDVDVVGGAYRLKNESGQFAIKLGEGAAIDANGLLELPGIGTGFLRIRRPAIEALAKSSRKARMSGVEAALIFDRTVVEGDRVGGDYAFCLKTGRVFCDPSLLFTHQGPVDFVGRLADHLGAKE